MGKIKKFLLLSLLASSVISIISFIVILWLFSIRETPTCANYSFNISAEKFTEFNNAVEKTLIQQGISLRAGGIDGAAWSGKNVNINIYAHPDFQSTIFVCAGKKKSLTWQSVSSRLETIIFQYGHMTNAHIQMDPEVFYCRKYKCMIDIAAPINFAEFNREKIKSPSQLF